MEQHDAERFFYEMDKWSFSYIEMNSVDSTESDKLLKHNIGLN